MKKLILGAVITGALGTAGATQWEYGTLKFEFWQYSSGQDVSIQKWEESSQKIVLENKKDANGNYKYSIYPEDFWNKLLNTGNKYKFADVIEWGVNLYTPFLNAMGANRWELVDVIKNKENFSGSSLNSTIYLFKREIAK